MPLQRSATLASLAPFSTLLCMGHIQPVDPVMGDRGGLSQALFRTYRPLQITTTDGGRRRRFCRNEAVLFCLRAPPALMLASVAACAPGLRGRASAPRDD